ncbi:metallophosphoesterase [Limosilactobacillus sp. STM2_1]|uniref:Metallophosphoesterase n=1 Tax=Limosilactobacillus rudii TaxID=2759755 RepID=A0A7W3UMW7_9LACO|nr:metallophosphoesterase [Limosilactobacillus rudii]MBB1080453.1 metallophosphoesterase [Limosilactobacillus rudii]MBB1098479.1 metallophosphoesterase [Limosilactobacillus rudii]MCD7135487.1 metallophosphoesterase [Limosilactobacillus rudii]
MRIAVSSDLHLDLNHAEIANFITQQVDYLTTMKVDYYFSLGDMFNDFAKTEEYFKQLQQQLPTTQVFYLAGNHDMLKNVTYNQLENLADPHYLHNHFIDLPKTNWRVIGNNGWYDYSFSQYYGFPDKVARWKKAYWIDRNISQPMSDQARMINVLTQVRQQLTAAQISGKQVLFMTHFAPEAVLLPQKIPSQRKRRRMWEMVKAMMGSQKLGDLLAEFPVVRQVFYGHLHYAPALTTINGIAYRNCAVGVQRKNRGTWQDKSLLNQWISRLYFTQL